MGEIFSTFCYILCMEPASHQYAEIVTNQDTFTKLRCHLRDFECF